jgi:phage tail-like protein
MVARVASRAALISRPIPAYTYFVEMKSVTEAIFTECTGLQIETEVYEYKEGGVNSHVHRLPGRSKMSNITLKRGMARPSTATTGPWDSALWKWYWEILNGNIVRQNFSIVIVDSNNPEPAIARWNVFNAFPIKWIGPTLKMSDNAIAIETLELAHQGIRLG